MFSFRYGTHQTMLTLNKLLIIAITSFSTFSYSKKSNHEQQSNENSFFVNKQHSNKWINIDFKPLPFIYSSIKFEPEFAEIVTSGQKTASSCGSGDNINSDDLHLEIKNQVDLALYHKNKNHHFYQKSKTPLNFLGGPTYQTTAVSTVTEAESNKFVDHAENYQAISSSKAKKFYEQALQIYPDNVNALVKFANYLDRLEDSNLIESADKLVHRALIIRPGDEEVRQCRENIYNKLLLKQRGLFQRYDYRVSKLHELMQEVLSLDNSETSDYFDLNKIMHTRQENFFAHVYHTIAIEGSTLNFKEVKQILQTYRTPVLGDESSQPSYSYRELLEVIGAAEAFQYANWTIFKHEEKFEKFHRYQHYKINGFLHGLGEQKTKIAENFVAADENDDEIKAFLDLERPRILNLELVIDLHVRLMLRINPKIAGRYRKKDIFVSGYKAPSADKLDQLMQEFGLWLEIMEDRVFFSNNKATKFHPKNEGPTNNKCSEKENFYFDAIHPVRFAAEAHYRLVKIHPFEDGNGRLSRLLMNLILMRGGYPPTLIKLENRQEYFQSLDYDGSFLSFIIKKGNLKIP